MGDPTETLETENVVASTSVGQELDLLELAMDLPGADYDPEQFPGLVYRLDDPDCATLLFRSGKVVVTGAASVAAAHEAVREVFDRLADLEIPVADEPAPTIQNVVTSADVETTLNLEAVAIGLGLEQIEYEPEQFPGLVYRMETPDVVTLLFGSGKVVVTGATSHEDAATAVEGVTERLTELGLVG
ncbi:TATA-box-binding protein [Halobaculum sp. MBLA0147]|uniref:TATA-box-binding protein n=1 Tax=Halobaculum sp. MBLA0147 TaxID=3079934 RepID=UPI0035233A30